MRARPVQRRLRFHGGRPATDVPLPAGCLRIPSPPPQQGDSTEVGRESVFFRRAKENLENAGVPSQVTSSRDRTKDGAVEPRRSAELWIGLGRRFGQNDAVGTANFVPRRSRRSPPLPGSWKRSSRRGADVEWTTLARCGSLSTVASQPPRSLLPGMTRPRRREKITCHRIAGV